MGDVCWYCGGRLIWMSDYDYEDVYGEDEGIVTHLACSQCGALVEYTPTGRTTTMNDVELHVCDWMHV